MARALDLIENGDVDAAVLDVNLGNGDTVYPVADKLSALGVPYLCATGDVKFSGADTYRQRPRLEKPFSEAGIAAGDGQAHRLILLLMFVSRPGSNDRFAAFPL
ncbi:hypothetical protein ACU4GA_25370 [Methylobacterium oryzae CBMB20]